MAFDFSDLTHRQKELLTFQGWHSQCGRPQPTPGTVRKLIDRRLIREHRFELPTPGIEYEVPVAVHVAWCAHCAALREKSAPKP